MILISQSGETADTLRALKIANKKIRNPCYRLMSLEVQLQGSDQVIYSRPGPEIGVAATKTYVSQLTCIYMLAIAMNGDKTLLEKLKKVPSYMKHALEDEKHIIEIAKKYKDCSDLFFIGRGFSYPTALEGALKLKEITYIHGEVMQQRA